MPQPSSAATPGPRDAAPDAPRAAPRDAPPGPTGGASRRERRLALLACVLVGVLVVAPLLMPLGNRGHWNWIAFSGAAQAEVTSLQRHGQFPLWNPWRAGGTVAYAEPQSMFLTPVTPLALLVGVMPAFKLLFLPAIVAGCWGFWLLAGRLGMTGAARLLPPVLVFGSTVPVQYLVNGLPHWLFGLALLPWLLLAFELALDDHRHVLTAGLLWAAVLYCGDVLHFVYDVPALLLWAAASAVRRRSARPLLVLLGVGLAGLCFAAARLLPLADVYAEHPRIAALELRHVTPLLLLRCLADPTLPGLLEGNGLLRYDNTLVDWYDTSAYVGPLAVLAAVAAVGLGRRAAAPLLLALGFAWLACGSSVSPDLHGLLSRVPVFASMRLPERLTLYVLVGVALLAGLAIGRLPGRWRGLAALATAAACLVPAVAIGLPLARAAFPMAPAEAPAAVGEFRQGALVCFPPDWGSDNQAAVLANIGDVYAQHDVPTQGAVRPDASPLYRGEVYLRDGHGRVDGDVTPHRIRVRAELDAEDVLLLNQNWFPGWRATGSVHGALADHGGLPGLRLPPGRHELELRFTQRSVPWGVLLTLATCVAAALYVRRAGPRRGLHRREALLGVALLGIAGTQAALRPPVRPAPEAPHAPQRLVAEAGADLQALVDRAGPGDVLLLPAGSWPGLRVGRGLRLAATGPARLTGPLRVEGLPRGECVTVVGPLEVPAVELRGCDGTVTLQATRLGDGGLEIDLCERVHLADVTSSGPVRARRTALSAEAGALAEVEVEHGALFLAGAGLARVRLRDARLIAEPARDAAWPAFELHAGSVALLSGGPEPQAVVLDGSSRLQHLDPPRPRLASAALTPSGGLRLRVEGTPGDTVCVVAGDDTVLRPYGRDDNPQLVDLMGTSVTRMLVIPAEGGQELVLTLPGAALLPGQGWFVQAAVVRPPGLPFADWSMLRCALRVPVAGETR